MAKATIFGAGDIRRWTHHIATGGPRYRAILDGLVEAIRQGDLHPGERLPPQRALAAELGVDLTTVTRAFTEARKRGLIEGAVGRGTFVQATAAELDAARVDLSMNLPPPPEGLSLGEEMARTAQAILGRADIGALMTYQAGAGGRAQRLAGVEWLAPVLGSASVDRLLVAGGAQAALAATLSVICRPGDVVLAEPLTYPGLKAVAAQLGLRLVACPMDEGGPSADGLAALSRAVGAKALYLVPSLNNPTTLTLGEGRRRALARAARLSDLWIIEDDPYSRLLDDPPPAIAALGPDRTIYLATLSKTLTPGLRIAFVAAPDVLVEPITAALRALTLMTAPLMASVATQWIREGRAEALLAGVRSEARARRAVARARLPLALGAPDSLHVWVPLADAGQARRLEAVLQAGGVSVVGSDAFAISEAAGAGLRLSLGGPMKRSVLDEGLATVARLLGAGLPAA